MPLNINYEGTVDEQTINFTKLKTLLDMTPVEVGSYIDGYVQDLDTAKQILIDLAMLLRVAAKEIKTLR